MKEFETLKLSDLAGEELVKSMTRELEGTPHDETRWPSRFAVPGPKAAPRGEKAAPKRRWGLRFAASGLKSAPPRH